MATSADQLIQNLLGAGGLVGTAFAQGRQNNLEQQQGQQRLQFGQMQIAAAQRQQQEAAQYQQDTADYSADPTPQKLAGLMAKYPEQADAIKKSYDVLDAPARESRLTNLFSLYSAADKGRADIAAQQIDGLITAEKAQGVDTSDAEHIRDGLKSSDETERTNALAMLKAHTQAHLAIADSKFADLIGLGKDGSYTLEAGATRFDKNGSIIARSPFLKDNEGNVFERDEPKGGGQPSGGGGASSGTPFDPHQFFKDFVLPHEGGYAAHDANGAPVNMGVNQAANPGVDVKNLTKDQAADIFATKYAPKAASLPAPLAAVYADTAYINPARAEQFLKASGGDPGKFMTMRQSWMADLVAKDPAKYGPYEKAWNNRNRDLRAYAQQAGGGGASSASGGAPAGFHRVTPEKPKATILSPQEASSLGLNPAKVYQRHTDGTVSSVGDAPDRGIDDGIVGEPFLRTLPAGRANLIRSIAAGKAPAPRPGSRFGEALSEDLSRAYPDVDQSVFPARQQARKDFTGNGKSAQVITSAKRFTAHLNSAWDNNLALGGANLGPFSGIAAGITQSFDPAHVKAYNVELDAIQGEFQKLTKLGAAHEGEAQRLISEAKAAQSQAGRSAALIAMAKLVDGAVEPMRDQWKSAFGDMPPPVDFDHRYKSALDNILSSDPNTGKYNKAFPVDHNGVPYAPAKRGGNQPVQIKSAEDYHRLSAGAHYIDPHGQPRIKR